MSRRHVSAFYTNTVTPVCAPRRQVIPSSRCFSVGSVRRTAVGSKPGEQHENTKSQDESKKEEEQGAMARRLSEMTEQAVLEGGRSAQRNMQQAGFSDELKQQLEERVAAAAFKNEYAAAHSIADMPSSAGQGTRDIASAQAWTGTETTHDITLRMLDDSKKRIRTPYKIPQPNPVDMRISPKPKDSTGVRLAKARERTATYSLSQSEGISEDEREAMRREMRERFSPGARPMPATLQGLSALANERIEDAMARGQFNRIKRGKGVNTETDHRANSPFIDTTEYFMNKMIQKQEIVPPWIEKQQDLAREVDRFRSRLRAEWRRHAARLIASEGGSLDVQMRRADAYAAAEARLAERAKIEKMFRESDTASDAGGLDSSDGATQSSDSAVTEPQEDKEPLPYVTPLRDPQYMNTERSFLELTIKNLNALTRTYNLQAPPVAQKPYLNLERELAACYAEVAPSLAEEIKRRATERARPRNSGPQAANILESLSTSSKVRVYEEDQAKGYGFKEFWRDLFSKKK
ncbi:DnaJ family domain-containing protein [Aspergillus neoniger CBS 115656]|uniref:DnaJ homologue subfamily C member 28 conserved domain-containing protein n=1 Tax=Aspergillus neoniger (strain CBS 115656) TaxID=1448310 RepID=A0A318YQM3_ASPNB|nr:hypothetical protein BO87DRAFT_413986 [Aspergillus neoniger CBS 115656]PYH36624.1 hypothetical protein BO87DRAFT_413986 [Aspergillus neoniger CBS 115656]